MKTRTVREYILLLVKGLAMGAADVVPGVSGGTIAFITGIYDELLHSLKNLGPAALLVWWQEGFVAFWRHINGGFLLAVFGGILVSVKTFASVISFCLDNYPLLVWAFFTGLIAASLLLLAKTQDKWRMHEWCFCLVGTVVVVFISLAKPVQVPGEWWMLFFGGFIAICAMILPGISGSFILLLLGLYSVFLEAVNDLDLIAIASFGAGCVAGLLCFSRALSWLLDHYMKPTIAVLMGFLIGSLNVTWPWKQTIETTTNRHGEVVPLVQQNVLPAKFAEVSGQEHQLMYVIVFIVFGVLLVLSTEYIAKRLSQK